MNCRKVGETGSLTAIDLHPSNEVTHRFVLQGLQKFTSYQVEVQAYNKQGLGPASDASVATTMEDGRHHLISMLQKEVIGLNNVGHEVKANGAFTGSPPSPRRAYVMRDLSLLAPTSVSAPVQFEKFKSSQCILLVFIIVMSAIC